MPVSSVSNCPRGLLCMRRPDCPAFLFCPRHLDWTFRRRNCPWLSQLRTPGLQCEIKIPAGDWSNLPTNEITDVWKCIRESLGFHSWAEERKKEKKSPTSIILVACITHRPAVPRLEFENDQSCGVWNGTESYECQQCDVLVCVCGWMF